MPVSASIVTTISEATKPPGILLYLEALQQASQQIFSTSTAGENLTRIAKSHHFASEVAAWVSILKVRRESELIKIAAHEYGFALLALSQGHYRHAFKALRLVLELSLQAVYLSTNELRLRDWLASRRDTIWSVIIDSAGEDSIFSPRFSEAFFPELKPHLYHHRNLASKVYRECSECVHGNLPSFIPLPSALAFDQTVFDLWHAKADIVAQIIHFALTLRYFNDFTEAERIPIEPTIAERMRHIAEIRVALGGPTI